MSPALQKSGQEVMNASGKDCVTKLNDRYRSKEHVISAMQMVKVWLEVC